MKLAIISQFIVFSAFLVHFFLLDGSPEPNIIVDGGVRLVFIVTSTIIMFINFETQAKGQARVGSYILILFWIVCVFFLLYGEGIHFAGNWIADHAISDALQKGEITPASIVATAEYIDDVLGHALPEPAFLGLIISEVVAILWYRSSK